MTRIGVTFANMQFEYSIFLMFYLQHLIVGDGIHDEAEINERLKPLIDSSLAHYMASRANQYRFCITVDCHGVYAVCINSYRMMKVRMILFTWIRLPT